MKIRNPQIALRFEAEAPDPHRDWHDGAALAYLGDRITLRLATDHQQAHLEDTVLHLPLPPEATSRQIRDAAEAWLRQAARQLLDEALTRAADRLGQPCPAWHLSFAARGSWIQFDSKGLRCHWRLIEQSPELIDQIVSQAVATLPREATTPDLFAFA